MGKTKFSVEEIMDKLRSGKLSRRQVHQMLAAVGVGIATVPLTSRTSFGAAADEATYFTWAGYDIPELFGQYQERNGTLPNFAVFGGSEEALTKMRAGYVVDVSHPCNQAIPRWMETGLFGPLDTSKLSNWGDVMQSLWDLPGAVKDGNPYFAPMDWGQTSITYRTDLVDLEGGEESWGILWDPKYKGRIGIIGSAADTWWCAAIYAGVPFEELSKPENVKKVEDVLRAQQPLVRLYTDDMTTLEQALASGEMVAAMTWNSTPVTLKAQGVPVAWASPKEGALTWVCGAMMHKDAPYPDMAHEIIDSLISPEAGKFLIDDYGYGHSNLKSFDLVSDERLAELGLSRNPDEVLQAGHFQIPQSQEFEGLMNQKFEEIKTGIM